MSWFLITSTALNSTGGSPSLFLMNAAGLFSFLGFPARLKKDSFNRIPRNFLFGRGRVSSPSSSSSLFRSFRVRCSASTTTSAPVYSFSPAGRCFRLLQELSSNRPIPLAGSKNLGNRNQRRGRLFFEQFFEFIIV